MARPSSEFFIALFHHRWAVPVMAELHRSAGGKYVTLVSRLGISKDSLRWTLEWLMEAGWVIRNPGHGHPMRPEYVLTDEGVPVGLHCLPLMKAMRAHGVDKIALRKWSMPLVHAIRCGFRSFSALKSVLPAITPRALSLALGDLQGARLIERVDIVEGEAGVYRLTKLGGELGDLLAAFLSRPPPGPERGLRERGRV